MELFVSFIYTLCGLSYTILSGYGKYFCFIFGLISSVLYSYLSFKNALWGNFALNFLYYIPIQIISMIKWHKNTDKKSKTVNKIRLKKKAVIMYLLSAVILSLMLLYALFLNSDKSPILDGFITVFSIFGAYLTLKRALEQWILWNIVNFLTILMWINLKNYFVVILWIVYFILGIIFYIKWKKELDKII